MPFVIGETVGPYRIVEQLGQGGMATVFKAYHPALDRYVAIKAMHPAFMEDPNFLARFQREAQVVARLDHPHIVPIYDYAEHQGRPYLVMKFIEGETLKARLSRGPLEPGEILRIVDAVGSALTYAHEQGILHRDIKPSNVLLTENGQIYLADFGLARIAEAGQSTLSTDVMLGTPAYISPEQAMGKRELGASTDIYSFGVVLYEMVVGRVPFSADTPYSIIHDHIYTPLPLPRTINPQVSEGVERVLLKALAKEPEDRYTAIGDLCAAFREAMQGEGTVAASHQVGERPPAEAFAATPADGPVAEAGPEAPGSEAVPVPPAQPEGVEPEKSLGKAEPKRRRLRWWYAVPLLLGLCICGFIGLNLAQGQGDQSGGVNPEPGVSTPVPPDRDEPGLEPSDPVEAARQAVREHPDDPFAHLDLAMALLDIGQVDEAQAAMQEAQALAGEDNPDFYLAAGDQFAERELWVFAAGMYVHLAALEDGRLPSDVKERMELSIYRAAEDTGARLAFIAGDQVRGIDPLLIDVARARFQLYQGKPVVAQGILDGVLERQPDYPPAQLLQAEILLGTDEPEPAVELLEMLVRREEPPHWVRMAAEFMLGEIQP